MIYIYLVVDGNKYLIKVYLIDINNEGFFLKITNDNITHDISDKSVI